MKDEIRITLLGDPIANARHRTGQGREYTPTKTRLGRESLADAARREMAKSGAKPFACVALDVHHLIVRPLLKGFSRKQREAALKCELLPISRPDFDNYAKMVDALKHIVWDDDSRICHYEMVKIFGEQPRVTITVSLADCRAYGQIRGEVT